MILNSGKILPGKVLVREIKEKEKTASGIVIPVDVVRKKTYAGEVVIVGDPHPNLHVDIKVGDKILHSPHAFVGVEIDGEEYRLLNISDILFIWNE